MVAQEDLRLQSRKQYIRDYYRDCPDGAWYGIIDFQEAIALATEVTNKMSRPGYILKATCIRVVDLIVDDETGELYPEPTGQGEILVLERRAMTHLDGSRMELCGPSSSGMVYLYEPVDIEKLAADHGLEQLSDFFNF